MVFHDVIHGAIEFEMPEARLVADLMECPEVQRLRHMRLLNFDVPAFQDLSTARRYAHAVGTCFLTARLCSRSGLPESDRKALTAAALVHDVGIPPYGHLVEAALKRIYPEFSHESIFRDVVFGTYHPTNVYHQILPGRSLRVASVLRKHGIDPAKVVEVVEPEPGSSSPICGQIDLDNIDNVHRMAALIGVDTARSNVTALAEHTHLSGPDGLLFDAAAIDEIGLWSEFRATMYSLMIAHPDCVAYNAYLHDMVELAVGASLISPDEWFLSDRDFEDRLSKHELTSDLAAQLVRGCEYALIDYVWLRGPSGVKQSLRPVSIREGLPEAPVQGGTYFTWAENAKIHRTITADLVALGTRTFGENSTSLLVALINPGAVPKTTVERYRKEGRRAWRCDVQAAVATLTPDCQWRPVFPETFAPAHLAPATPAVQYELF
ncbi:HD domain-containing protein [Verrucomicrobiota bacterium]